MFLSRSYSYWEWVRANVLACISPQLSQRRGLYPLYKYILYVDVRLSSHHTASMCFCHLSFGTASKLEAWRELSVLRWAFDPFWPWLIVSSLAGGSFRACSVQGFCARFMQRHCMYFSIRQSVGNINEHKCVSSTFMLGCSLELLFIPLLFILQINIRFLEVVWFFETEWGFCLWLIQWFLMFWAHYMSEMGEECFNRSWKHKKRTKNGKTVLTVNLIVW